MENKVKQKSNPVAYVSSPRLATPARECLPHCKCASTQERVLIDLLGHIPRKMNTIIANAWILCPRLCVEDG